MLKAVVPGLVLLSFFCFGATAQEKNFIAGRVINGETEAPIPNASVFITNTSKGTVTLANGTFRLGGIPAGKYDLIISSVGYGTQVYSFSSDKLPLQLKIYLEPKATELETVIVEPYEKDGWEKWGKFFIENFIGTTEAAKLCKIRNYKTLRFRHSKKKNILTAVADEPLIIENRELGYRISYQLEDFNYDFKQNTLFYLGYTLFEDMAKDTLNIPKRFLRERHAAYKGSIVHFIRSLYNNNLVENEFEVKRVKRIHNDEKDRVRAIIRGKFGPGDNADSSEYYNKILRQEDYEDIYSKHNLNADSLVSITGDKQRIMYFDNYIQVMYRAGFEEKGFLLSTGQNRKAYHPRSLVSLLNGNPVAIDKNGSCYPATEFFSSGYWAWSEKISHLLPIEYDDARGR
ncbi:carboxypeptidase-like regulatory domain-containing protein [Flavitalea sp.]|nr:carboxypeptidase-like regulatory domain-containing protein [Flavitalea sp.]